MQPGFVLPWFILKLGTHVGMVHEDPHAKFEPEKLPYTLGGAIARGGTPRICLSPYT